MAAIHRTDFPDLYRRGKIRDTYDLGGGLLLMVSTDRISAFDVVVPTAIPDKGLVLSQLSAFLFRKTPHLVPNHLVALADDEPMLRDIAGDSLLDSLHERPIYANDFPGGERRVVQQPTGLRYTIVNGAVTFEGNDCTGALPGKLLRSYDMVD